MKEADKLLARGMETLRGTEHESSREERRERAARRSFSKRSPRISVTRAAAPYTCLDESEKGESRAGQILIFLREAAPGTRAAPERPG